MGTEDYPELKKILLSAISSTRQQEVAEWCGVSQAAVSLWINGKKKPKPYHLLALASLFHLDPSALALAVHYSASDIERLQSNSYEGIVFQDLMEKIALDLNLTHRLLVRGDPDLAIEHGEGVAYQLRKAAQKYPSRYQKELLLALSRQQFANARAYSIRYSPKEGKERMSLVVNEHEVIAERTNEDEPAGWAYYNRGALHYALGNAETGQDNYLTAQNNYLVAYRFLPNVLWRFDLLPIYMVCCGYTGNKRGYRWAANEMERLLDRENFSFTEIIAAREGQSRALALLGDRSAFRMLDIAKSFMSQAQSQGQQLSYRQIQLVRSEIEILQHLEAGDHKGLATLAEYGWSLAYPRHYVRIANNFAKILGV